MFIKLILMRRAGGMNYRMAEKLKLIKMIFHFRLIIKR